MNISMYKKRESIFDDIVQQAYLVAQQWAMSVADQVPVPLHKLAKEKNIHHIRFEPLISTSGLVKAKDGFDIFINTEAIGVTHNQKAGTVQEINSTAWSNFDPSLLFGIAHEIAHVIFLDVAGGIQKKELLRRHNVKLERACSNMARMLLIPKQRLIREIEGRLFDVNHIETLVKLFNVSSEVFIWRFQLKDVKDVFKDADGLLAYTHVEKKEQIVIRIIACHIWGDLAKIRFTIERDNKQRVFPEGLGLRELPIFKLDSEFDAKFDEVNSWLLENEKGKIQLQVPWTRDSFLPCEPNFCRIQNRSDELLIGIKVAGNIGKRRI